MKTTNYLIVIVGPTAVGKSAVSLALAHFLGASIVSADSRQVFRELEIGTGALSHKEQAGIPHYLVGSHTLDTPFNAGLFEQAALPILDSLFTKNNIAIVCGGTGLYVHSLLYGLDDLPPANEELRSFLTNLHQKHGIQSLQNILQELYPSFEQKLDKHNPHRLMRAIEILEQNDGKFPIPAPPAKRNFIPIVIGLNYYNRETLYQSIHQRIDTMLANGWLEEARRVYPHKDLNALNTVGYKELFAYIDGKYCYEEALIEIKKNTRHYAKRQITYFNKMKDIQWFEPHDYERILLYIQKKLVALH